MLKHLHVALMQFFYMSKLHGRVAVAMAQGYVFNTGYGIVTIWHNGFYAYGVMTGTVFYKLYIAHTSLTLNMVILPLTVEYNWTCNGSVYRIC